MAKFQYPKSRPLARSHSYGEIGDLPRCVSILWTTYTEVFKYLAWLTARLNSNKQTTAIYISDTDVWLCWFSTRLSHISGGHQFHRNTTMLKWPSVRQQVAEIWDIASSLLRNRMRRTIIDDAIIITILSGSNNGYSSGNSFPQNSRGGILTILLLLLTILQFYFFQLFLHCNYLETLVPTIVTLYLGYKTYITHFGPIAYCTSTGSQFVTLSL